jgi:AAA domain
MSTDTNPAKHLRVVSLSTTNFKKIKAARIDPDPSENVVLIGGEIDQGKSSLLDSMMAVLGGKEASPEVPVRKGMKKGSVVLDLGELTATLRFTAAGGRELIVEDKEGNPQKSPQALMDKLTGKVGFDAEAFLRFEPKQQLETLRKIVGIDFAPLEAKKATLYSQRTAANSVVKTLETQLASAPNPTDAPAELVDTTAVLAEIQKAQEHNKGREPLVEAYNEKKTALADSQRIMANWDKAVGDARSKLAELKLQIVEWERKLKESEDSLMSCGREVTAAKQALEEAEAAGKAFVPQDTAPIQAKLVGADAANNKFRQAAARKKLAEDLKAAEAKATALDNAVQEIDGQKEKMLLEAKFPVKGLGFTESGITFDGLPFDQAASSTKRRVSVAIGAALNPTLRVMVIKDGSLLGTKGIDQVRELANEFDLQVWIEVVTSDEEDRKRCTVVIEDGSVAGAPHAEEMADAVDKVFEKSLNPATGVSDPISMAAIGAIAVAKEHATPPKDLFGDLPPQ